MILSAPLETKLYAKESVELPDIIKERFPKIQFVFQPESIEDIRWLFSYAGDNKLSLIPRGAATSGTGAIAPLKKSILADMTLLNRILGFDSKKKIVCLEAGLRWWDLRRFLKKYSLDCHTYPTSLFSTVGGWISTGGYGINSLRYGHVANWVDSIEVITPKRQVWIDPSHPDFKYFLGTEGQMGIITKVKLKVRQEKPAKPSLVFFKNSTEAVGFLSELFRSTKIQPTHISYFDQHRLAHKNLLLKGKVSFPKAEAILVVFEDSLAEPDFLKLVARKRGVLAEGYLTALLWNERFFPFAVKRFHPSLLGAETILPLERLNLYLNRIQRLRKNYGLPFSTEASLINRNEAVVFTIFPSDSGKISHFFHLLLSYSLTHAAISYGGRPYGIGLWNLPLLAQKFSSQSIKDYRRFKIAQDPLNVLNPSKSFSQQKITSLLKIAYRMSTFFSNGNPLLKAATNILNHNHRENKRSVPAAEACASCGACVAVCPAYLETGNEIVTAKGKLFLLNKLQDAPIPARCAEKAFLCLHCRLCESVCQSKLALIPVWERLESVLARKYGFPREKIEMFIKKVESDPAYAQLLDSLGAPSNNHWIEDNV